MAVHDIDMNVVGARFVDGLNFVTEAREICGEDRRCDPDGLLHNSLYQLSGIAASAAAAPVTGDGCRLCSCRPVAFQQERHFDGCAVLGDLAFFDFALLTNNLDPGDAPDGF